MSITGPLGGEPTRVGPSISDISAGLFTTIGILLALVHRNNTDMGQKVDVAMLDCQVSMLENAIARYVVTGSVPKPNGNRHTSIVPFEPFDTKDSKIVVAVGNDSIWKRFCSVADLTELVDDERFATNPERNNNYDALRPIMAEKLKTKTTTEWQKIFDDAGVPNGPINSIDQVITNEQVLARDMIVEVEHPVAGKLKMPGVPIKLSETPGNIEKRAPLLGEHSLELLVEILGYGEDEVKRLMDAGVI